MHLSRSEAQCLLDAAQLPVALTGLPSVGKSERGRQLAAIGFEHLECDTDIAHRLSAEYGIELNDVDDVAGWMGMPNVQGFVNREARYLYHEAAVLREVTARLQRAPSNIAVDTTGSSVHVGQKIFRRLQSVALVVYLEASPELRDELFRRFVERPKPILFDRFWRPFPPEPLDESLRRCYGNLVEWREREYPRFADVILPVEEVPFDMDGRSFLELVLDRL
ncbi:MAG: hypothetical protein K0S68_1055 [Candidatus Saccharibacteria bacterium]|jgi:shikimate kinase|nr:hypothetical protein [Candidatus Saccharibacteria bacterium]